MEALGRLAAFFMLFIEISHREADTTRRQAEREGWQLREETIQTWLAEQHGQSTCLRAAAAATAATQSIVIDSTGTAET